MERLEPVLKQKFWILLGIGILMTIAGWWMATGTMAATITTRRTEIKAAEDKVKNVSTGDIPNDEWSASLGTVNGQQDLAVKSASRILWERQRARMTWPETVAGFAWKNGYRGAIDVSGRENYRTDYDNDWRRVWESVQPFNRIDGSGIVDFSAAKLPRQQWGNLAPSSDEMWDAQEDLWLLEGILQLIAEVNGGANSTRLDACIHQIERLTLHGGQPAGQRAAASGAATSGPAGNAGTTGMMGGFGSGGTGGGGAATAVSVDFDPKEELGDDGGGGGQSGPMGAMPPGPGGLGGTAVRARRYIDDDKALPFRTRGFYMTLIMDHRKIPNLISELSSSDKSAWPIEIVRVQYVRLHEDDTDGKGAGGGSGLGMPTPEPFGAGGGPASPSGDTGFGGPAASGFSLEGTAGGGGGVTTPQGQTAIAALMNAVQDPNMARVTICGIITLYNKVDAEETPAGSQPVVPTPVAAGVVAPQAAPVEGTAPSTDADVGVDAKSAVPADGEPASPDSNATPTPEAAPKQDEATPATPVTKPAGTP